MASLSLMAVPVAIALIVLVALLFRSQQERPAVYVAGAVLAVFMLLLALMDPGIRAPIGAGAAVIALLLFFSYLWRRRY